MRQFTPGASAFIFLCLAGLFGGVVVAYNLSAESGNIVKEEPAYKCDSTLESAILPAMKQAKDKHQRLCFELNDPEALMGWWCIDHSLLKPHRF